MTLVLSRELWAEYSRNRGEVGRKSLKMSYAIHKQGEKAYDVIMTTDGINFVTVETFRTHAKAVHFLSANNVYPGVSNGSPT